MHEIQREAQYLANHGVQRTDNKVLLPYESDKEIELSLDSSPENDNSLEQPKNNGMPSIISIALRVLLSQAHLQNLHDRSKPPGALREDKQPRKIYPLLGPIVQVLQHRASMSALRDLLHQVGKYMTKAGIQLTTETESFSLNPNSFGAASNDSPPARVTAVLSLINALTSSVIHVTLPGQPASIKMRIATSTVAPNFGTSYHIHHPSAQDSKESVSSLPSLPDFESELCSLLQKAIKHYITNDIESWRNAENGVEVITRSNSRTKSKDNLSIFTDRHELRVNWHRSGKLHVRRAMTWVWYADNETVQEGLPPLREVLENLPTTTI